MRTIVERVQALQEDYVDAREDWLRSHEQVMVHVRQGVKHVRAMRQCEATIDALTPPQTESRMIRYGEVTT